MDDKLQRAKTNLRRELDTASNADLERLCTELIEAIRSTKKRERADSHDVAIKAMKTWSKSSFRLIVRDDEKDTHCFVDGGGKPMIDTHEYRTSRNHPPPVDPYVNVAFDVTVRVHANEEWTEADIKAAYDALSAMSKDELVAELERLENDGKIDGFGFIDTYDDNDPELPEIKDTDPLPHVVGDWSIDGPRVRLTKAIVFIMHPDFPDHVSSFAFRRERDGKLVASFASPPTRSTRGYHQGVVNEKSARVFSTGDAFWLRDVVDAKAAFLEIEASMNRVRNGKKLVDAVLDAFKAK